MAKENERDEDDEAADKEILGPKGEREVSGADADIDITDVEDDDGDEEGRPSKKDRRSQRYTELETRLRASEERAVRFEQELSAARQRADAEAARAAARPVEEKDEYQERINRLMEARQAKLALIRRTVGDEQATTALARESLDLEGQISDLRMERAIKKHSSSQQGQQPQINVERKMLEAEFPAVYANAHVQAYAQGQYLQMRARGAPDSLETARKANRQALIDMGIEKPAAAAPSAIQQMRHGGTQSSNGNGVQTGGKVRLSGGLRKLARARASLISPNDDDDMAEKKFAKRLRDSKIV